MSSCQDMLDKRRQESNLPFSLEDNMNPKFIKILNNETRMLNKNNNNISSTVLTEGSHYSNISQKIIINKDNSKNNLLYGNPPSEIKPKYIGKTRAFLFIRNSPLIIIGPDCK